MTNKGLLIGAALGLGAIFLFKKISPALNTVGSLSGIAGDIQGVTHSVNQTVGSIGSITAGLSSIVNSFAGAFHSGAVANPATGGSLSGFAGVFGGNGPQPIGDTIFNIDGWPTLTSTEGWTA